jgi:hypothetical protein
MTHSELEGRYGWQFQPGRGIDRCTPPSWLPELASLFAEVEAIIPVEQRKLFSWSDVKEKRGRLAVDYIAPASCDSAITAAIERAAERMK